MNIEFCEENSGTSKEMRYFRKNKRGHAPQHFKVDPRLLTCINFFFFRHGLCLMYGGGEGGGELIFKWNIQF